jgi:hypothetical protein
MEGVTGQQMASKFGLVTRSRGTFRESQPRRQPKFWWEMWRPWSSPGQSLIEPVA